MLPQILRFLISGNEDRRWRCGCGCLETREVSLIKFGTFTDDDLGGWVVELPTLVSWRITKMKTQDPSELGRLSF
jgi:hypothetical protein